MDREEAFAVAGWLRQTAATLLHPQPRAIALFGSFARFEASPQSDLDILLVGDAIPRRPYERTCWLSPLLRAFRSNPLHLPLLPSLSPLILTERGWLESVGLRLSLGSHAWILQDDGFLSASLHESRASIERGEWERKGMRDGGWLWIPREASA